MGMRKQAADPRRIVAVFEAYMKATGTPVSQADYMNNLAAKITHPGFLSDLSPLLAEGTENYDPQTAFVDVRDRLVALLGVDRNHRS